MHLISCTNTHRDVTDLVNHGMVKNTKTWISWERNIIFLRNKKILNLCFRWHILRSYCFVVEVTFKWKDEIWRNYYQINTCCMRFWKAEKWYINHQSTLNQHSCKVKKWTDRFFLKPPKDFAREGKVWKSYWRRLSTNYRMHPNPGTQEWKKNCWS